VLLLVLKFSRVNRIEIMQGKRILVVSVYFPPFSGGSIVRIHNFVKYLGRLGNLISVLTMKTKYYENLYSAPDLLKDYNSNIEIVRTDCIDLGTQDLKNKVYGLTKKNSWDKLVIGFLKRIVNIFLIPDRLILWGTHAFCAGLKLMKSKKPISFCLRLHLFQRTYLPMLYIKLVVNL